MGKTNWRAIGTSVRGVESAFLGPAAALGVWTLLAYPNITRAVAGDAEADKAAREDLWAAAAAGSLLSSILFFGFEHPVGALTTQVAALALFGYGMHSLNSAQKAA